MGVTDLRQDMGPPFKLMETDEKRTKRIPQKNEGTQPLRTYLCSYPQVKAKVQRFVKIWPPNSTYH